MTGPDDIGMSVRRRFNAYRAGDREEIEAVLHDDLTFTSPYDDGIDRTAYFARCWPNRDRIKSHTIERLLVGEGEAFVQYMLETQDGTLSRNVEHFTYRDGKIADIDVYFGRTVRDAQSS